MANLNKIKTLPQIINFIAQNYNNDSAFAYKIANEWHKFSNAEFSQNVKYLALGLREIGLKDSKDGFAIIAESGPFWLMFDFAAICAGSYTVPIFANIAKDNLIFEIKDANAQFIFCDSSQNLEIIKNSGLKFKKIITHNCQVESSSLNDVININDLINIGQKIYHKNINQFDDLIKNIDENSLATIIYTSGSTGIPKGVKISHKNLISQIKAVDKYFPLDSKSDIALSFLPLAHIFERMVVTFYIAKGMAIYFADDVKNVGNLIKEVEPTLMTVVPRMLEKVFASIKTKVNETFLVKRIIGNLALGFAMNSGKKSIIQKIIYKIFDILLYKKLRGIFGNNLKMIICGGAPLNTNLEKFFIEIGINLYPGYGLTESSPVISVNRNGESKIGTVGKVIDKVKVKLDKDGELMAKGANIMLGYHNNFDKTAEVITKDGWLRTGDLAQIDNEGFIKIIGRKKELFKTAGGKYVSPFPIEQKLVAHFHLLTAALVIAENRKFVSCLLFVDFDNLRKYKEKLGFKTLSDKKFLQSDIIQDKVKKLINKVNDKLNSWERIQKYHLIGNEISISGGELTPSMKLRRGFIEEKYRKIIDNFYQN